MSAWGVEWRPYPRSEGLPPRSCSGGGSGSQITLKSFCPQSLMRSYHVVKRWDRIGLSAHLLAFINLTTDLLNLNSTMGSRRRSLWWKRSPLSRPPSLFPRRLPSPPLSQKWSAARVGSRRGCAMARLKLKINLRLSSKTNQLNVNLKHLINPLSTK